MDNKILFQNFSDELLCDPKKFGDWVASLFKQGYLHGYTAVQPFAEELVERFFKNRISFEEKEKNMFLEKFENYGKDGDRYSFEFMDLFVKYSSSPKKYREELITYIGRFRKEAESYLKQKAELSDKEISDLFYHFAHNMGGSSIYTMLTSIEENVNYFKMHLVETMEDLENYLQNYQGKFERPLEKFKQDKTLVK